MNYDSICRDMIKALEEEIDSIKKSGGSNQIALSDGKGQDISERISSILFSPIRK